MIKFEVKEGDYVDVTHQRQRIIDACMKKIKDLGFSQSVIHGRKGHAVFSTIVQAGFDSDKREVTLEQLMFCDQPDDVTHCYYDGENITYNSGDPYAGALICTREPAESKH